MIYHMPYWSYKHRNISKCKLLLTSRYIIFQIRTACYCDIIFNVIEFILYASRKILILFLNKEIK
jgi:hypothetical protein